MTLTVGRGAVPDLAPRPAPAHRIRSDAEALDVAHAVAETLRAGAAARDRDRALPLAEIELFSQSGLWAATVPRTFGGAEVSRATLAEVAAIVSAADGSIGQVPQNHWYLVEAVRLSASPAQQARLFAAVLEGDRWGNALTELGGRTPQDFRTTVLPAGDGRHVLSGEKFYSTGALYAHTVVAAARNADGRSTLVFVPRGTPGLGIVNDWSSFGQRTTGSGTTRFDAIAVDDDALVSLQDCFDRPTPLGPFAQLLHTAVDVGIARAALADALDFTARHARPSNLTTYAMGRDDPYVIHEAGQLAIEVTAADAMLARAAEAVDVATADPSAATVAAASIAVAEAKALATEVSVEVSSRAFALTGSRSTLDEFRFDRHWRNARTHTLHDQVRYKYVTIGNWYLRDIPPPRTGTF